MTKLVSPEPDAVSEALRSLAVRSTIFCLSELRAPWAFRVDGEKVPKFHLVLEGSAYLSCGGKPALALAAGDLVVLPHGAKHTLADDEATPASTLERLLAETRFDRGSELRYGGAGAVTRLLCGGFSLAEGVPESVLSSRPAESWTLDRLAKHVGLSRTALAVRFRDRIGVPPMRYLTKLRLSQAAGYLAAGQLSIQEIAILAGYQNDATLSRAFKREFGQAPGAYRARARQPPVIEIA